MLNSFFDNLRYDHPFIYRSLITVVVMACVLFLFFLIPPSPLMRVIGVTSLQERMSALYYATFWQVRAAAKGSDVVPVLNTTYGNMAGLDPEGKLVIAVPSGTRFVHSKVNIADIRLVDLFGAATLIGQLRTEDARFDIYHDNQVVVWIRNVPFNVKLIEAGFAIPEPNPPTSIVDKAFSAYYWRIFNGGGND